MQMEMPQVQDQHRKLQALAGKWAGEEKIHPSPWDPKGGTAVGKMDSRIGLHGFSLIMDYTQECDGKPTFEGHGVYGWDPKEQCYTMHWFDSMGGGSCSGPPAKGKWEGNALTFVQQSEMGHGRFTYKFEGDGRFTFLMEHSQDGKQWAPFMDGRYSKK